MQGNTQRVENTPVCRVYGEQDSGDDGQGGSARTCGMSDLLGEVSTADGAALCNFQRDRYLPRFIAVSWIPNRFVFFSY